MAASAQAQLNLANGYASGQWFNPARDGEGFYVEIIDTADILQISVAMYSYDEAGNQLWLLGNIPIEEGDVGSTIPVYRVEGPVWGPMYDPADRTGIDEPFGNIVVQFPTCDSALFNVQSNDPVLESGNYSLVRLTDLVSLDCVEPPPPDVPPPEVPPEITPGLWTGDGVCFFVNTEPSGGYQPGTQLQGSELCNGFTIEAEVTGVETYFNGETGPACQASIDCFGNLGINLPGQNSYGQVACQIGQGTVEILFTSATESVFTVNAYTDQEGTLCVGQGGATPAQ